VISSQTFVILDLGTDQAQNFISPTAMSCHAIPKSPVLCIPAFIQHPFHVLMLPQVLLHPGSAGEGEHITSATTYP
jgi:hypothetical protein